MPKYEDIFFTGLGIGAGVAVALGVQALWIATAGLLSPPVGTLDVLAGEAQTMGLPLAEGSKAFWYVARAGGSLAYLLLWLATLWGVLLSSKMVKGWVDATVLYNVHEFLPTLAMVFAVAHTAMLMGDAYIRFSLLDLLIPFRATYRPLWTGFGSLALYLSAALIASFYLRSVVSRRVWRVFHYAAYLAFILALVHGLFAGTDTAQPAIYWMYVVTGATLLFATIYRVLAARSSRKSASHPNTRAPATPRPGARRTPHR
jgi:predicted ferric reductase